MTFLGLLQNSHQEFRCFWNVSLFKSKLKALFMNRNSKILHSHCFVKCTFSFVYTFSTFKSFCVYVKHFNLALQERCRANKAVMARLPHLHTLSHFLAFVHFLSGIPLKRYLHKWNVTASREGMVGGHTCQLMNTWVFHIYGDVVHELKCSVLILYKT